MTAVADAGLVPWRHHLHAPDTDFPDALIAPAIDVFTRAIAAALAEPA